MIVEKLEDDQEGCAVYFFILCELFVWIDCHCGENQLGQLREYTVIVVLTDSKVDIVASDHVLIQMADLLDVLPLGLVYAL